MIVSLIADLILGIVSFLFVILSLGVGFMVVQIVSKPTDDFTKEIISSLVRFAPVLKRPDDPDFDKTKIWIGLIGAILSFTVGIFPVMFYYDVRMYLFFLGMAIFFGALGLIWYCLWIYLSGK